MQIYAVLFNNSNLPVNRAFQALFDNRPTNLAGMTECTIGYSPDCPYLPSDFDISTFPAMALLGQAANNESEGVLQRIYYGPWTTQTMYNVIQGYAGAPAPQSGNGGVIPSDNTPETDGDFGNSPGSSWTPNLFYLLLGGYGAYRAITGRGNSRLVWGAAGGYFLTRYYNRAQIGDIDPYRYGIGKITDGTPIKPGSRVTQYWYGTDKIKLDLSWFGGRKTYFEKQTIRPTVAEVVERFGLHSLEFGNWVNENERMNATIAIGQSLADLAKVMNVAQKKVGFNGRLAIAYGARGRGMAKAHYNPNVHLINLTKTNGANSLAHEYGHALDAAAVYPKVGLATESKNHGQYAAGLYFNRALDHLLLDEKGPTEYAKYLADTRPYYQKRAEIWARTFETWLEMQLRKKRIKNFFLAKKSYHLKIYPRAKNIRKIDKHIRSAIQSVL